MGMVSSATFDPGQVLMIITTAGPPERPNLKICCFQFSTGATKTEA